MSFALIVHYVHSDDPKTGGVLEAAKLLSQELNEQGFVSELYFDRKLAPNQTFSIVHGLWQWPGTWANKQFQCKGIPYLLFPHGMLDRWFRHKYPLKHIKKQAYWWFRQGKILRQAHAVCYTTEEERRLARKTFWPHRCLEKLTGLGIRTPPAPSAENGFLNKNFPKLKGSKFLLYLGRIHPKKGLDMLIKSFSSMSSENEFLVIAGPIDESDSYYKKLFRESTKSKNIIWAGMVEGNLKWEMLRQADALTLPSHQENFGIVVAEALSVGTPVFLTNKVNLWREVDSYGAGVVAKDNQAGIDQFIRSWKDNQHGEMASAAMRCFEEKLHIRNTASNIIGLLKDLNLSTN